MYVGAVLFSFVSRVAFVGWHKWVAMFIIIELCGLKDKMGSTYCFVMTANPMPFVFVGTQAKHL